MVGVVIEEIPVIIEDNEAEVRRNICEHSANVVKGDVRINVLCLTHLLALGCSVGGGFDLVDLVLFDQSIAS